jgi:hypothetical protein
MKYEMLGKKFGDWSVIAGPLPRTTSDKRWVCQCECGTVSEIAGYYLRNGKSKGCGCKRSERVRDSKRTGEGKAGLNQLFLKYKIEAKNRGYEFAIDKELFEKLTKLNCHYCGREPYRFYYNNGSKTSEAKEYSKYLYNGLDRLNNDCGYTESNVAPCCWECNRLKGGRNEKDFIDKITKIVEYTKRRKQR